MPGVPAAADRLIRALPDWERALLVVRTHDLKTMVVLQLAVAPTLAAKLIDISPSQGGKSFGRSRGHLTKILP